MNKLGALLGVGFAALVGAFVWQATRPETNETGSMVHPDEDATKGLAQGAAIVQIDLPQELSEAAKIGQRIFEVKCAVCHGENAVGQNGVAPPLVHRTYEPSHHSDIAFQLAVQNGVRAHHWRFGNMPPIDGLTRADVQSIVAYVRELQRANGIY